MTRPIRARIDLQALRHNFHLAREAAAGARVMAVIKANAYGHGAVPVARALPQADAFALASVEEAVQLREAGIDTPLVVLAGVFAADELEPAGRHDLQLVVHSEQQVQWLERSAATGPLRLWLKVDTGMHRLGIEARQLHDLRRRLAALIAARGGQLRLMSHLACADTPRHPANDSQLAAFLTLDAAGQERSLANSAALISRADMRFDWVRPGIMLYGASPFEPEVDIRHDLRPVMTLETRLMAVRSLRKGDKLGYGHSWTCPVDMPVGVAAVGYGDGYPRHAPTGTPVLVNGKVAPLIGRVSMDMLCVDLRGQPETLPGAVVQLWGRCLPIDALANRAGTLSYELLCNVNPRVAREYVNGED